MKFTDEKFKALKKEWYARLKKSGFEDIEKSETAPLSHSTGFRHGALDSERKAALEKYFEQLRQLFWDRQNGFASQKDREIFWDHANGASIRELASHFGYGRDHIHRRIRRILGELTMEAPAIVMLRCYDPMTDKSFIYATWTRNHFYSLKDRKGENKAEWMKSKAESIANSLETGTVFVACLKDDPDFIIGYSVFQGQEPEWMYLKRNYRHMGIEALLLAKNRENSHGESDTDRQDDRNSQES